MPVPCPKCGFKHDVKEFRADRKIKCECGFKLDISDLQTVEDFLRYFASEAEGKKADKIQEEAQLICRMILDERTAEVDIEIAKAKLRDKVVELFPDKLRAYEMIYEARFNRLWEQFRGRGQGSG